LNLSLGQVEECFVLVWFGLVWFGLVWFGLVWFGLLPICRLSSCGERFPSKTERQQYV
jgi:hypothetical protein